VVVANAATLALSIAILLFKLKYDRRGRLNAKHAIESTPPGVSYK